MPQNKDDFLERMRVEGKIEDILEGLRHKAALVRINGIMNAARFSVKTPEVIDLIKNLKKKILFLIYIPFRILQWLHLI